jgi:hypothetical protein
MPKTVQDDVATKPVMVRLPLAWYSAIQRQAKKNNRNIQGQMRQIVEDFLRATKELPAPERCGTRDH